MKTSKKVLIFSIVIVLVIAIIYGFYYGNIKKEASIIREISRKQEEFLDKDNYYQKITKDTDTSKVVIEHYQKGKKSISFTNAIAKDSGESGKEIIYCNNGETKIYRETSKEKILEENGGAFTKIPVNLKFSHSSDKELIDAMKEHDISIKSSNYNGKDCYIYKMKETPEVYFEKETGLVLKYLNMEFEFEFDNVDDKIFELDLSGYTLVE